MGLEPTRLLHPTRFPGELLSHSVNPPKQPSINLTWGNAFFKINIPCHALCFLTVIPCTFIFMFLFAVCLYVTQHALCIGPSFAACFASQRYGYICFALILEYGYEAVSCGTCVSGLASDHSLIFAQQRITRPDRIFPRFFCIFEFV